MVFNFKGDGCSKDSTATECVCNCGGTGSGDCTDCPYDELEYYELIYGRTDLWRSIGVAAAKYIVDTNKLIHGDHKIFFDITKESFLSREAHFTISV